MDCAGWRTRGETRADPGYGWWCEIEGLAADHGDIFGVIVAQGCRRGGLWCRLASSLVLVPRAASSRRSATSPIEFVQ
jgi:hypothetical protein